MFPSFPHHRSVLVLDQIVAAVAYIPLYIRGLVGRPQGGVHQDPAASVKIDGLVHPARLFQIYADPGVILLAGVAHHQLGGNPLAAQQRRHQGGVIIADALSAGQGGIRRRDIPHRRILGHVHIVGDVLGHIPVNLGDIIHIRTALGGDLNPQAGHRALVIKPGQLIGIQVCSPVSGL